MRKGVGAHCMVRVGRRKTAGTEKRRGNKRLSFTLFTTRAGCTLRRQRVKIGLARGVQRFLAGRKIAHVEDFFVDVGQVEVDEVGDL